MSVYRLCSIPLQVWEIPQKIGSWLHSYEIKMKTNNKVWGNEMINKTQADKITKAWQIYLLEAKKDALFIVGDQWDKSIREKLEEDEDENTN